MFTKLARGNFLVNVLRFLSFRDDISIHISGNKTEIFNIIKIIGTGYLACIKFNMGLKLFMVNF